MDFNFNFKLTILFTSPIRSTLQSSLLVKRNLATITKINEAVKTRRQLAYDQFIKLTPKSGNHASMR